MEKINPEIFRGYDIRGISEKDLDYDVMERIGKAHGTYLKSINVSRTVVGYDNRVSTKEYKEAIISGLRKVGINVIDIGLALSPIVYWAQYFFKTKGAVMVTGSHNPAEYNGVKLGRGFSDTLTPIQEIKKMVIKKDFQESQTEGSLKEEKNYIENYYQELIAKAGKIKPFKIVVDASNGPAGKFYPELLRKAGCEVIEQNCRLDGTFPNGTPDPTEEKISQRLAERVIKEKADLGFSYDADGDRIGIVDEKGGFIWNDVLVAIFAEDVIMKNPGAKIVYNALCSKVVDDVIKKAGGEPILWLTGHAFIKDRVHKEKAPFGGELSGHFFFFDNFYGHDDAGYASLRLLSYLTAKSKSLSEVVAGFPQYISSPEIKIGCPDSIKNEVIDRIKEQFIKDFGKENVNDLDGARANFADGMMIIRASQNGPYITVKFEAKDKETYEKRRTYIRDELKKHPEIDWSFGVNEGLIK
jgi:phosphomannomutase/phosphoglucomutase